MRSATVATKSCSARTRSVVSGISRISRAMAVCVRSCSIMRQLVDNRSQITLVFEQCLNGFGLLPSQAKQYGNLDIALRALNEVGSILLIASHDLANDDLCTAKQLRVACAHAYHQTPIDAAQLDHDGRRKQI